MATQVEAQMATHVVGNTSRPRVPKARDWQFTLNEVDKWDKLLAYLSNLKSLGYGIACHEVAPTTGHEHIHVYTHFDTPFAPSIKKCQGAHIERCNGSPKQNIEYIRKDGDIIWEFGDEPKQGARTIGELKKSKDLDSLPIAMANVAERVLQKERAKESFMEMLREIKNDSLTAPEVIYITGEPGTGKTYGAYKMALATYPEEKIGRIKFCNQFAVIDNEEAECFVIEEFRGKDLRASELLQLLDKYGTNVNTKGGFVYIRAKCIILCSIFEPGELYKRNELTRQFTRRINKYYLAENRELKPQEIDP